MAHPDRDLDVFPYACLDCRKRRYLLDLHADLDDALFVAWLRNPLAMMDHDGDPPTPITSRASLP